MTRSQFEHVVRAAGAILAADEVLVIGSQAIHGSVDGPLAPEAERYYAQGVVEATAVLPAGWRERLVRFETPATNGVVAWCLEPHDLWGSKAIANRPRDVEFCEALRKAGLVDEAELERRLDLVEDDDLDPSVRRLVLRRIQSPPQGGGGT